MKKNYPEGNLATVIIPDDVTVAMEALYLEQAKTHKLNTKEWNFQLRTKKSVFVEILRRGIESLYNGAENIPVDNWDADSYNYLARKHPRPVVAILQKYVPKD